MLPDEVWIYIANNLHHKDLMKLRLSCRYFFHNLADLYRDKVILPRAYAYASLSSDIKGSINLSFENWGLTIKKGEGLATVWVYDSMIQIRYVEAIRELEKLKPLHCAHIGSFRTEKRDVGLGHVFLGDKITVLYERLEQKQVRDIFLHYETNNIPNLHPEELEEIYDKKVLMHVRELKETYPKWTHPSLICPMT